MQYLRSRMSYFGKGSGTDRTEGRRQMTVNSQGPCKMFTFDRWQMMHSALSQFSRYPNALLLMLNLTKKRGYFITPLLHFSQSIPAKFFIKGTKLKLNLDRVGHQLFGFVDMRIEKQLGHLSLKDHSFPHIDRKSQGDHRKKYQRYRRES